MGYYLDMEKAQPHYDLVAMQTKIATDGAKALTVTAIRGGESMGVDAGANVGGYRQVNPSKFL